MSKPNFIHKELREGRWVELSLMEELGIFGSDVGRARSAEGRDTKMFQDAVDRALDLFDLTLEDPRWKGRREEIARAREVFCDAALGGKEYETSLEDLENYFMEFAIAARK